MRIVQYTDTYEKVGGTETYCSALLVQLERLGHTVFWLANGKQPSTDARHIVLEGSRHPIDALHSKYFFNKKHYLAFKKTLQQLQPDVVHLHHNRYHTYALYRALDELKIPVVQTIHDYTILCPSQYYPQAHFKNCTSCPQGEPNVICSQNKCVPLYRRLFYPFLHDKKRAVTRQRIGTFIAPTRKIKRFLERADFQNVRWLPFYIDPTAWSFDAQRTATHTVIFVGRVEINKGIYPLLDTVIALRQQIPQIELHIIGTGQQIDPIRQKIAREQLDYVHLQGAIPHESVKNHLRKATVCVVPTLDMEQFGLVGIEAMASGTAVIGSNRGGIPEWCIHNQTGLLFEPNKEGALENALHQLLSDTSLRQKFVQNGFALIRKKYTLEKHFDDLLDIYRHAKPLS